MLSSHCPIVLTEMHQSIATVRLLLTSREKMNGNEEIQMADINNPTSMETYPARADGRTVGCFARIFRRGPHEIPLSPTTRHIANSENSGDGRQSTPIRPIKVTALIHRDSIELDPKEHEGLFSLTFTLDCTEATMIKLINRKKKLLASQKVHQPQLGLRISLPLEAGWVKSGECSMFLITEPFVCKQKGKLDPYIKSVVNLRRQPIDNPIAVSIDEQLLCVGDREYEVQEIYGQATGEMLQRDATMRDVGNSCVSISIREQQERLDCVVCLSDHRDTLFLPCRHLCICSNCAEPLVQGDGKCPICRQSFESIITLQEEIGPKPEAMKEISAANQPEPNCRL